MILAVGEILVDVIEGVSKVGGAPFNVAVLLSAQSEKMKKGSSLRASLHLSTSIPCFSKKTNIERQRKPSLSLRMGKGLLGLKEITPQTHIFLISMILFSLEATSSI